MMGLKHKVAARYLTRCAAVVDTLPPQIRAVLMKARRGVLPPILKDLVAGVKYLGWQVEDVVVPMITEKNQYAYPWVWGFKDEDARSMSLADWQQVYETIQKKAVSAVPTHPTLGDSFITDVKKPKLSEGSYAVFYTSWRAVPGMKFTDSGGHEFTATPDPWNASENNWKPGERLPVRTDPLKKWLKTQSTMTADSTRVLDMGEYVPGTQAVPISDHGAGTCPACFGIYKLRPGGSDGRIIVLHGYQRPGWGYTVGKCFGVGYSPYELSVEGTVAFKKYLDGQLDSWEKGLAQYKSGNVKSLHVPHEDWRKKETVEIHPDSPRWQRELETRIREHERTIKSLESDIITVVQLINKWELRPLPKPGSRRTVWKE